MKCNFVVGQRVVCITDKWWRTVGYNFVVQTSGPVRGDVVKILEIGMCDTTPSIVGLNLAGYGDEAYDSDGFRPLQDRPKKTSIEVFRKLVTPTKVREDA